MNISGQIAEDFACQYLQNQGLTLLTRNFHSQVGEIDLIMHTHQMLIFVEVKYREYLAFGGPAERVILTKQRKLTRTAQYYLHQNPGFQQMDYRFDVLAIACSLDHPEITWIQDAFSISIASN